MSHWAIVPQFHNCLINVDIFFFFSLLLHSFIASFFCSCVFASATAVASLFTYCNTLVSKNNNNKRFPCVSECGFCNVCFVLSNFYPIRVYRFVALLLLCFFSTFLIRLILCTFILHKHERMMSVLCGFMFCPTLIA